MRILKYLLLLLLLFIVGLTVFVTTQKGNYTIVRSKVIKTPRATLFNYINDYRNWETFNSYSNDDKNVQFVYSKNTVGKNASLYWKGNNGEGNIKTLSLVENQSINQQMIYNSDTSDVFWTFKDTLGKTKVSWRTTGKMNVMMKINAFLNGGIDTILGEKYEKSLANIDKTLDYELNTYNIKVNGIVNKPKTFYINQTINCETSKVSKNIKILIPKLVRFFEKNKMVMHGKPFVLYNSVDVAKNRTNLSVCIPIKDSINIMAGSEIESGKLEAITTVKTTLTGDYLHLKKAKEKAIAYILENKLIQNFAINPFEIYNTTIVDVKNPSKWITEIYIPVYPKVVQTKTVIKRTLNTQKLSVE